MFVRTSKKITNHSKTFSAPELIGQLGKALAQGHNISVGIWKMVAPLRIVIITKTDPLKKSLLKFARPGTGCLAYSGINWYTLAYIGIYWHTLAYSGILWTVEG